MLFKRRKLSKRNHLGEEDILLVEFSGVLLQKVLIWEAALVGTQADGWLLGFGAGFTKYGCQATAFALFGLM